jgi:hypothetical protein
MALLHRQWDKSLPDSGFNIVSMLVNEKGDVYAGSNGYVYRLDYWTGTILATNPLRDRGHEEVRLATLVNASLLIVGTNGYVLGLHPTSLTTLWERSLSGSGFNIVSVLCACSNPREINPEFYVYAGCNGYTYRLTTTGDVVATNPLTGYGKHEVRLGISPDLSTLFVGINGYVLALGSFGLVRRWYKSLPGSGKDVTSVVAGRDVVYAGSNGRVYMLQQSSGDLVRRNNLEGTGSSEVRMALNGTTNHLYVGTNGYGVGLRTDTLATVFSVSLPGSGYSVTDVVAGDGVAYFANGGYVFQLDLNGNVTAKNPLTDMRKFETRLAVNSTATGQLLVGTNGYALGLALPGYPTFRIPWMKQMASTIGPMMLRNVAIPGTHDSGTYGINLLSYIGEDDLKWLTVINDMSLATMIAADLIDNWAISQTINFTRQLASGIRYFDLRVQWARNSLNFVHGLVGPPVTELFEQLSTFLSTPGNEKEVVLLDFNHLHAMTPAAHEKLTKMLLSTFGNQLTPAVMGMDVTLDRLWATTYRIIIFYDDPATVSTYPFLWSQWTIRSPWPNKQDVPSLHSALNAQLPNRGSNFFVLQGVVTPNNSMIGSGLVPWSTAPGSLLAVAKEVNPQLELWLHGWRNQGINIVICDWFNFTNNYVNVVVKLNEPASGFAYSFDEQPKDGNIDEQPKDGIIDEQPKDGIIDEQPKDGITNEQLNGGIIDEQPEDSIDEQPEDGTDEKLKDDAIDGQSGDVITDEQPKDDIIGNASLAQRVARAYRNCVLHPSPEVEALLQRMEGYEEEAIMPVVVSMVGEVVDSSLEVGFIHLIILRSLTPQLQALASGEEAARPAVGGEVVVSPNSEVGFIYLTYFYVH